MLCALIQKHHIQIIHCPTTILSSGVQHCMLPHTQINHCGCLLVASAARAARTSCIVQAALTLGPCMQTPHSCKQ